MKLNYIVFPGRRGKNEKMREDEKKLEEERMRVETETGVDLSVPGPPLNGNVLAGELQFASSVGFIC